MSLSGRIQRRLAKYIRPKRRHWVPFLESRLMLRHRFVIERFKARAWLEGSRDNKEAQEEYLKTLKYVSYQQEIDSRYVVLLNRFPFFYNQEQLCANCPAYWESLPQEAKKYYRALYKSGEDTSAYNILYPPMCDKRLMDRLFDDLAEE